MKNVFVTAFSWDWRLLGYREFCVKEDVNSQDLHKLCLQVGREYSENVKDIHFTVTTDRPTTPEEAKKFHNSKGPDIEDWLDRDFNTIKLKEKNPMTKPEIPPDSILIVCNREKVADSSSIVPNSKTETCFLCKENIIISPSSLKMRAEATEPTITLCVECARAGKTSFGLHFPPVSQVKEFKKGMKVSISEAEFVLTFLSSMKRDLNIEASIDSTLFLHKVLYGENGMARMKELAEDFAKIKHPDNESLRNKLYEDLLEGRTIISLDEVLKTVKDASNHS
jgi:hypothetical protein